MQHYDARQFRPYGAGEDWSLVGVKISDKPGRSTPRFWVGLDHQRDEWVIACGDDRERVLEGLRWFRDQVDDAILRLTDAVSRDEFKRHGER